MTPVVQHPHPHTQDSWSAMAKVVREFDEEKIKGYKEDIDALLVFAGLFSAILTAFLVVAYPALQPASQASMPLSNDQNSTQTLPPPHPTPISIVTNILWFSSLIVGLAVAFLGILVKQWLHQYLAFDTPSPYARLRLRHERHPHIERWMVYDIAACLPFLLQLALYLFFAGLCCFTAAIHNAILYTTMILVVLWTTFTIAVTVLPGIFPECPYKTSLLNRPVAQFRRLLTPSQPNETPSPSSPQDDCDILLAVDAIHVDSALLATTIVPALHHVGPHWNDAVRFAIELIRHRIQGSPPNLIEQIIELEIPSSDSRGPLKLPWIFDDPFADLKSIPPHTMDGILETFSRYMREPQHTENPTSGPGSEAFVMCALSMIISRIANSPEQLPHDTTIFLQSFLRQTSQRKGAALFKLWLRTVEYWEAKETHPQRMVRLLGALTRIMESLDLDLRSGERCFMYILSHDVEGSVHSDEDAQRLEWADMPWTWPAGTSRAYINACLCYLFRLLALQFSRTKMWTQSTTVARRERTRSLLGVALHLSMLDTIGNPSDREVWVSFETMVVAALNSQSGSSLIIDGLIEHSAEDCWYRLSAVQEIMPEKLRLPAERLDNIQFALRTVFQPTSSLLEILQLCHAAIVLLISVGHAADGRKQGRELFVRIASRINLARQQIIHGSVPTINLAILDRLARKCLVAIDREETFYTSDTTFRNRDDHWEEMFSEEDSIFPDALVQSLAQFNISGHDQYSNQDVRGSFRVLRLLVVGLPNGIPNDFVGIVEPEPPTDTFLGTLVHILFGGWLARTL